MFQVSALNETYLGFIPILQEAMTIVLNDYKVLLESFDIEMNSMIKINHARQISRIGFFAQEMKDHQSEVFVAIQNRANEIGNNSADCILDAERELQDAVTQAGATINYSARQWKILNDALVDGVIYETVNDLKTLISLLEFDLLNLFVYFNSVTDMYSLLSIYQGVIQTIFDLFDYFVDLIFRDMSIYDLSTNQLNRIIFISLENGSDRFRLEGELIVQSLSTCSY